MNKNYKQIEFRIASNIEDAVIELFKYKEKGMLVCGDFNGTVLYSDTVTMDSAYKQITGKTKLEFDKAQQEWRDNYEKEKREHKEKIPQLSEEWKKKGREILKEDKWGLWDKIVPIRLGDLYRGMELGNCLDIVGVLNSEGTFDDAKEKLISQSHSGMSYGLVCSMVKEFSTRGKDFIEYISAK